MKNITEAKNQIEPGPPAEDQPQPRLKSIKYAAKLALSKYQNHEIGFSDLVPETMSKEEAMANLMRTVFNAHEAIVTFRELKQHVKGLRNQRQHNLRQLTNAIDQHEQHKAELLRLLDQAPPEDADLVKRASHQEQVLCRRESLEEEETRVERMKQAAVIDLQKAQETEEKARQLAALIKSGRWNEWEDMVDFFSIPPEEGHDPHPGGYDSYVDYDEYEDPH